MADEVAELQLFVEIIKAGNLSAAARALNSSPAAMSRGLSALESRLGVRLVTRTSRTFALTEEGQLFYERCERIVEEIAEAEAEASFRRWWVVLITDRGLRRVSTASVSVRKRV